MKTAIGTSFPTVRRLTTKALCRMPRTLIHPIAAITQTMSPVRGAPLLSAGQ